MHPKKLHRERIYKMKVVGKISSNGVNIGHFNKGDLISVILLTGTFSFITFPKFGNIINQFCKYNFFAIDYFGGKYLPVTGSLKVLKMYVIGSAFSVLIKPSIGDFTAAISSPILAESSTTHASE